MPSCVFPADLAAGLDTAAVRLLDPWVVRRVPAGHNITVSADTLDAMERAWRATNASRDTREELRVAWAQLVSDEARIFAPLAAEPVFYGACADEACVGVVVRSQRCVCPPH